METTSTSSTVPCFSNKARMSSAVDVQGKFSAANLVEENSSSLDSTDGFLRVRVEDEQEMGRKRGAWRRDRVVGLN